MNVMNSSLSNCTFKLVSHYRPSTFLDKIFWWLHDKKQQQMNSGRVWSGDLIEGQCRDRDEFLVLLRQNTGSGRPSELQSANLLNISS